MPTRSILKKAAMALSLVLLFSAAYITFLFSTLGLDRPRASAQEMLRLGQKIAADRLANDLFSRCPATIYNSIPHIPSIDNVLIHNNVRDAYCRNTPEKCLRKCTKGRNGKYCFSLARAFETFEWPESVGTLEIQDFEGRLFATACAEGNAGGCTNRAAGIRNDRHTEDPFNEFTAENGKIKACLLATFRMACANKDAWGCTMLGQSYALGEGTKANQAAAKEKYAMACAIDTTSDACDAARRWQKK